MIIDTPISAKIILELTDPSYDGERFISLSVSLYQQRLIFGEPRELRKVDGKLELTITFVDKHSFNNWLENPEIIGYWKKYFDEYLTDKPKTFQEEDVIFEVDTDFNCSCEDSKFFLLQGRCHGFTNELTCGNCLGIIPYSRVPSSIEIEQWQRHHKRVYENWLGGWIFEGSALRQLKNYKKGKLNLEGEKIRKELSEYFKRPVYLEYFVDEPITHNTCVICGGKGIKSGLSSPKRICKKCNTAFDYSNNTYKPR